MEKDHWFSWDTNSKKKQPLDHITNTIKTFDAITYDIDHLSILFSSLTTNAHAHQHALFLIVSCVSVFLVCLGAYDSDLKPIILWLEAFRSPNFPKFDFHRLFSSEITMQKALKSTES